MKNIGGKTFYLQFLFKFQKKREKIKMLPNCSINLISILKGVSPVILFLSQWYVHVNVHR